MVIVQFIKKLIKKIAPDTLLVYRLPKKASNSILLTFDDGPDESITPLVLKRLARYKVRAIFFVVGKKVEKYPEIFDMLISQGHIVANHTYNHPNQIIVSAKKYQKELSLCDKILTKRVGKFSKCIRPPLGISIATLRVALSNKRKIILWSIEGGEWGVNKKDSAQKIADRLTKNIQPRDIILLHDNNDKVLFILDTILPDLKKRKIDLKKGADFLCP